MKTAISLPNKLSHMAAQYAERHGLSINELYERAVSDFIKNKNRLEEKNITHRINEICDNNDTSLKAQIKTAAKKILSGAEW